MKTFPTRGCRQFSRAYNRLRNGEEPVAPHDSLPHAKNFLYMLTGEEPDDVAAETFDIALILHADHGLNASTFTAMTIASTQADIYNAVVVGIAALSGPLHGGANTAGCNCFNISATPRSRNSLHTYSRQYNQDVMRTLIVIDESDESPDEWTRRAIEEGRRILVGWGHRVYAIKDPRATILQERSHALAQSTGETKWCEYTEAIEEYLTGEEGLVEEGVPPNVDFYSGSVYYQLGIPVDIYTPIFAMSRVGGWVAHVREYVTDNRLIRPRGQYVGHERRDVVPIDER